MNIVIILVAALIAAKISSILYDKTDIVYFIRDKIKINSKLKCNIVDGITWLIAFMIIFQENSTFTKKVNIPEIIFIFVVVIISCLSEFTKREV